MKKNNLIKKIKEISSKNKSNWAKDAKFRIENKKWLDYSAQIAMRILAIIEDKENFNQVSLSENLKISPQQVSKILKGQQNLTLKTIGNISDALGFELISFPPYKDSFVKLMPLSISDYDNNLKFIMGTNWKSKTSNTEMTIQGNDGTLITRESAAS